MLPTLLRRGRNSAPADRAQGSPVVRQARRRAPRRPAHAPPRRPSAAQRRDPGRTAAQCQGWWLRAPAPRPRRGPPPARSAPPEWPWHVRWRPSRARLMPRSHRARARHAPPPRAAPGPPVHGRSPGPRAPPIRATARPTRRGRRASAHAPRRIPWRPLRHPAPQAPRCACRAQEAPARAAQGARPPWVPAPAIGQSRPCTPHARPP